jgi:plasmid maintenance system antidote protein VapI
MAVTHVTTQGQRFWMNLQSRYDLEIEKDRLGPVLDEIHPLTAASLRRPRLSDRSGNRCQSSRAAH